jgi:hypothetical protein
MFLWLYHNDITTLRTKYIFQSYAEFFNVRIVLARYQCHWYNTAYMHLRAENMIVQLELFAGSLDILQTLLVVRACSAYPNLDLVLDESRRDFT